MSKYAINEGLLQQIETLQLMVENPLSGMFGGNHQSKNFGSSCEFADYRDYIPGDDITKIDWRAYARFDHLYLKQFLDERQVHTRIYIDASRSMDYGKGYKAEKALEIAALFAYLSIVQMDKVSIYYIKDNLVHEVVTNMVGKENYYSNIGKLNDITFDGDIKMSEAILPTTVGYADGMSIIISDFLTDNGYFEAIDYLVNKKRDVFCIQILSKDELRPMVRGKVHFYDSEVSSLEYKKDVQKDIIKAYHEALNYITNGLKDFLAARNGLYMQCESDVSITKLFLDYFVNMGVLK